VILGLSDCDGDGMVEYIPFTSVVKEAINAGFKFDKMVGKTQLHEKNAHLIKKTHPISDNLDEMELFRTFKKYDRNMNGTLEFSEYT